ncbi:hypothetical protein [Psychroserpens sp. MEBiC05023]
MKASTQSFFAFIFLVCSQFITSQQQNANIDVISAYEDYTEMDREIVFAHLNKSIYIKGESIGVKFYVLDKYSKQLATQAANLYCTISDADGKVIDRKMFMVENGTAIGGFDIGDDYTSGHYKIKCYTNWMRNFDEDNLFVETIRIIDPLVEQQMVSKIEPSKIDAQFLPECGHLLNDTENILGIVIKNSQGLGIPGVEGELVNENDDIITNFKVNQFGIGKCLFTPKSGEQYRAKFTHGEKEYVTDITNIKPEGIAMSLNPLKGKIALTLKTNSATLPKINNTFYKLAIHNGQELKEIAFKFGDQTKVIKIIANQDLFSGLNIFTIFDVNNNPLLERLYYNYEGVNTLSSETESIHVSSDTISITLPYKVNNAKTLSSLSVSVLPINTNSFHHQNIISQSTLQPYLKGYVEQAQYYFNDVTPKKQFELDNLLITQGWSSYDWNTIFNAPPEYDFDYENGVSYTINSSNKGDKQLMIFPTLNHPMKLVTLTSDNSSYTASGLFPVDNEEVRIREINDNGKVTKPNLYVQFDPIKIPELESSIKPLKIDVSDAKSKSMDLAIATAFKKIERLDEVVINKKKEYTKIEKLNNRSLGNVEAIDETLVRRYRTLVRYLRDKGWTVYDTPGKFEIYNNQASSFRSRSFEQKFTTNGEAILSSAEPQVSATPTPTDDDHTIFVQDGSSLPIVYLDGMILHEDLTMLKELTLDQIEWVEVNKSGVGGGMRSGGAGLIRIKTKPASKVKLPSTEVYGTYDIPLKFSVAKKFYIPEYVSYETDFFKEFGVVDWMPNLTLNNDGQLQFAIINKDIKHFKVHIEGVINNGTFISEDKELKID